MLFNDLYLILYVSLSIFADAVMEFDLLGDIKIPFDGVQFVEGSDGFPAYGIEANADIKTPYRLILPEKLYEFALMATIRTDQPSGYLFAVVNPLDTIVQLGLKITSTEPPNSKLNVTLVYSDPNADVPFNRQSEIASFQVPYS